MFLLLQRAVFLDARAGLNPGEGSGALHHFLLLG